MDRFIITNDVKFRYGNIDHLVIRDDGAIFLIETKSHVGRVTTDGKQLLLNGRPFQDNYLCQVNRTIRWLRRMARTMFRANPWFVTALVFPNAQVPIRRALKNVNVMDAKRLLDFIRAYVSEQYQPPF